MSRRQHVIEEHQEPQLIYLRRPGIHASVELVVVEKGHQTIWLISDERLLAMIAEGSHFLATRPPGYRVGGVPPDKSDSSV